MIKTFWSVARAVSSLEEIWKKFKFFQFDQNLISLRFRIGIFRSDSDLAHRPSDSTVWGFADFVDFVDFNSFCNWDLFETNLN